MGEERRGGGLAMRAGHGDDLFPFQEKFPQGLCHRAVRDASREHVLHLRVTAADGVTDHHEVGGPHVFLAISAAYADAPLREHFAHGRIYPLVGTGNAETAMLEHARQAAHRDAADSDKVNGSDVLFHVCPGWLAGFGARKYKGAVSCRAFIPMRTATFVNDNIAARFSARDHPRPRTGPVRWRPRNARRISITARVIS